MAAARCHVSFTDSEGIAHAVDIQAESLYEAVALAVAEFRQAEIIAETPDPKTEFIVTADGRRLSCRPTALRKRKAE
jgi:hypothetical protein